MIKTKSTSTEITFTCDRCGVSKTIKLEGNSLAYIKKIKMNLEKEHVNCRK